jgi:UDPglucose 6-dehydrogenase
MGDRIQGIGVVGHGFVGRAVARQFSKAMRVYWYDSAEGGSGGQWMDGQPLWDCTNMDEGGRKHWAAQLCQACDGPIFICVPTPSRPDGACDTSIVEQVIRELEEHAPADYRNVAVIKSTVSPGTTDRLQQLSTKWHLVHNPEFLTERTADQDFAAQSEIFLGGPAVATAAVAELYRQGFDKHGLSMYPLEIHHMPAIETELIKYIRNAFYAVKIEFANEIYDLCQRLGVDYSQVIGRGIVGHPWCGEQHWAVPGPDGMRGFGGKCLPKDLLGLVALCHQHGVIPSVMFTAWQQNTLRRPLDKMQELFPILSPS